MLIDLGENVVGFDMERVVFDGCLAVILGAGPLATVCIESPQGCQCFDMVGLEQQQDVEGVLGLRLIA